MREQKQKTSPGRLTGRREQLHSVRDEEGRLLVTVDDERGHELMRLGLVRVNEQCKKYLHFVAIDCEGIALWLRSREGGSHTTIGHSRVLTQLTNCDRTLHRALRPLFQGARA